MFNLPILIITAVLSAADDYTIAVKTIGFGNQWRPGDVTPIQIDVGTSINEAQSAWIQWEVPDADGDHVFWGRPITLVPKGKTTTWLYAPTNPWDNDSTIWTIRLRLFEDGQPTGELSSIRFSPLSTGAIEVKKKEGSIVIFGTRRLGLNEYQQIDTIEPKHEATKIVSGLTKDNLPNAWPCFNSLDALVWADTVPEFGYQQAKALIQWINRGGHLIVTLPTIGDPWLLGTNNGPLAPIVGEINTSVENVELSDIESLLGRKKERPSFNLSIRTFGNIKDQWQAEITPISWLDDGRVVAIQKTVGFGAITVIGIDLANGRLASLGLPESDVFWNRVLGRRSDTPSQNAIKKLKEHERYSKNHNNTILSMGEMVAKEIAMSSEAGGRLGAVAIIVVSYWLISGPVAFIILRRKRKQQWSWVVFACTACVFSIGTWIVAANASNVREPMRHLSIVDHVYGGSEQRATGWFSLFLPGFGRSEVQILGGENNLLLPWTPPNSSMTPSFVDKREIVVNLNHVPDLFNQPSRATTSNFSYKWLGSVDHEFYDALIRVPPNNMPKVIKSTGGESIGLSGEVKNHSSVQLQDVTILWVTEDQIEPSLLETNEEGDLMPWVTKSGIPINKAYMWRMPIWGDELINLNLLNANKSSSFSNSVDYRYTNKEQNFRKLSWRKQLEMLSLYSHLKPPTYIKPSSDTSKTTDSYKSSRDGGRELDFAKWFGRPCLIIMGFLQNSPLPVPISVDGDTIDQSDGVTFVRWIYPLPLTQ